MAGNLAGSGPGPVSHGHLFHPQSLLERLDLHFYGPTVVGVLHPQSKECLPPDGTKRPQIGIGKMVETLEEPGSKRIPQPLVRKHRSLFHARPAPRPNHQIRFPSLDGFEQPASVLRGASLPSASIKITTSQSGARCAIPARHALPYPRCFSRTTAAP